jgi:hypothetical protein
LTAATYDALIHHNQADLAVYEAALQRFDMLVSQ